MSEVEKLKEEYARCLRAFHQDRTHHKQVRT
jgi:hypothetical protein